MLQGSSEDANFSVGAALFWIGACGAFRLCCPLLFTVTSFCNMWCSERKALLPKRRSHFMHHRRWDNALFLHFAVDAAQLQAKLPRGLAVDLYQGVALLSIVAISECGIEPRIPLLPLSVQAALAVSHHAVNVRTYVRPIRGNGPPGIYFFSLDCSTGLPALGARLLFNLPYKVASMSRTHASPESHSQHEFISQRQKRTIFRTEPAGAFHAVWSAEGSLQEAPPGSLAEFVVERYCLYCERGLVLRCLGAAFLKLKRLWRGDIDHAPWPLQRARVELLENTMLRPIGFEAAEPFDAHYSTGVGSIDFFFAG